MFTKFFIFISILFFIFYFLYLSFAAINAFFPSEHIVLYFHDLSPPFQPTFKPKYATTQEIEAYNRLVHAVNRNEEWLSLRGLLYNSPQSQEIPQDSLILHEDYEKMLDSLNAVFLMQVRIIAFLGGCLWGVITLIIVML